MADDGRPDWWSQAKCLGADPDLFFPEHGHKPVNALACCNGQDGRAACPVRSECHTYGREYNSCGVWGGVYYSTVDVLRPQARLINLVETIQDARPTSAKGSHFGNEGRR